MKSKDILKDIIQKKKERLIQAKQSLSEDELKSRLVDLPPTRAFQEAISKPKKISPVRNTTRAKKYSKISNGVNLIAEIKRASPSKGIIREDFQPLKIANAYAQAGAQAISVLTEEDFFSGNLNYIKEIREKVDLPILRKDFIFEAYQVYESRVFGADCVLLIAQILSKEKLAELFKLARKLDLDCLVEVHDQKDLKKALSIKAEIIGVNNRNLHSLEVSLDSSKGLLPFIPKEKTVVVESGIRNYQDLLFFKMLGANAVLIGEAFMEAEDIAGRVKEIMGW